VSAKINVIDVRVAVLGNSNATIEFCQPDPTELNAEQATAAAIQYTMRQDSQYLPSKSAFRPLQPNAGQ
jgi:hypothetical protein